MNSGVKAVPSSLLFEETSRGKAEGQERTMRRLWDKPGINQRSSRGATKRV